MSTTIETNDRGLILEILDKATPGQKVTIKYIAPNAKEARQLYLNRLAITDPEAYMREEFGF